MYILRALERKLSILHIMDKITKLFWPCVKQLIPMIISKAIEDIWGLGLDEQAMVYVLNYPQIKLSMINDNYCGGQQGHSILSIFNIYLFNVNIDNLRLQLSISDPILQIVMFLQCPINKSTKLMN